MAEFKYTGLNKDQTGAKGIVSARTEVEARKLLKTRQIKVLSIKTGGGFTLFGSVGVKDLSAFTRQFSTLIKSNLPLDEALSVLTQQTANKRLKAACESVLKEVRSGTSLGDALAVHPKIFKRLYCHMVKAGEAAGVLPVILNRLAAHLERVDKISRKVKGALTYPIVVGIIAMAVITALLTFVVPTFKEMFSEMGRDLPVITTMVLGISAALRQYVGITIIILLALTLIIRKVIKNGRVRLFIERFKLKLPILGQLIIKGTVSRFARTLSTLLNAKIPLLDALQITKYSANNIIIENGVENAIKAVERGKSFAEPLERVGIFPPLLVRMSSVGEKAGDLPDMLGNVAEYYEEEVNTSVDSFMSVLEPILIVLLGLVIGTVLMAMYLPLFEMITEVQ